MNKECEGCSKLITVCSEYIREPQNVINDPLFCNDYDDDRQNKDEVKEIVKMINDIYTAFALEMDMLIDTLEGKLKD